VLYRDGIPLAVLAGGETQFLEPLEPADEWAARKVLLRGPMAEPAGPSEKAGAAE